MNQKEYNGWTNYETWNVALWIDNEEGSQSYWQEQAERCWNDTDESDDIETRTDDAVQALSDSLQESFETQSQELLDNAGASSSVFADLLGAALSEVNWREIAKGMVDEVEKPKEETEEA